MRRANTQLGLSTQPTSVRSSGRFSRRRIGLTTLSVSFGLLQVLLNFYRLDADLFELDFFTGVLLWIPVTLFPRRFALAALLTFALTSLTIQVVGFPINVMETLRLALFGAIISFAVHAKPPQSPFFAASLLWAIGLLINSVIHVMGAPGFSETNAELVFKIVAEVYSILCISLLRFSRRVQTVARTGSYVYSLQVVLTELFGFAVITAGLMLGLIILYASEQSMSQLSSDVKNYPNHVLLTVVLFTTVPATLGSLFSRGLLEYLKHIRSVGTGANRFTFQSKDFTGFAELQEFLRHIRGTVEKSENDAKQTHLQLKELRSQVDAREEILKTQTALADNLSKVMQACPWGMIALSADGTVLSANKVFIEMFGLTERKIDGKSFTALEGESPWLKEVNTLFLLACRNYRRIIDQGPMRHSSSSYENHYLELVFAIIPSPDLVIPDRGTASFVLPRETAMALFVRKVPDLREFQLELLSSSSIDVVGGVALEVCRHIRDDFQSIVKHLGVALLRYRSEHQMPNAEDDLQLELLLLLQNVEQHLTKATTTLEKVVSDANAYAGILPRVDFSKLLQQSIDYLKLVLDLEQPIPVYVTHDALSVDTHRATASLPTLKSSAPIWITAPRTEVVGFVAQYAMLVRSILSCNRDIQVAVGYETIEASAATIIPGSQPGRFIRLSLTHPGQSISANMLKASVRELNVADNAESLETALTLFAQQTKKLGGFLTIQSSHSRGTHLTVYLPTERRTTHELDTLKSSLQTNGTPLVESRVLVITSDRTLYNTIQTSLRSLRYTSQLQAPDELFEELSQPADFSGLGFSESGSAGEFTLTENGTLGLDATDTPPSIPLALEAFDVIIYHLEAIGTSALLLLRRLERIYPDSRIIVVSAPQLQDDHSLSKEWARISLPLSDEQLEKALEHASR